MGEKSDYSGYKDSVKAQGRGEEEHENLEKSYLCISLR